MWDKYKEYLSVSRYVYNEWVNIFVQIPALNEEDTIGSVLSKIPTEIHGHTVNTVVINDGSTDRTVEIAQAHGVEIVNHYRNLGVGAAMKSGYAYALRRNADILVTIDADEQFDPHDIPALIEPILSKKTHFVTVSRFRKDSVRPHMPQIKYWGNIILAYIISKTIGFAVTDVSCGFRAYSNEALRWLNVFGRKDCNQETFISLAKHNILPEEIALPVYETSRSGGKSRVLHNLLGFSTHMFFILIRTVRDANPFFFYGLPGVALMLFGVFLYIVFLITSMTNIDISVISKQLGTVSWILTLIGGLLFLFALFSDMMDRQRLLLEEIAYKLREKEPQMPKEPSATSLPTSEK